MRSHAETIHQQFDPQSQAYLTSAVHAAGPDLAQIATWVAALSPQTAGIDVGTGAGHLAFAMARHFTRVVASDPSPGMLATVAAAAHERGHANLTTCLAQAESLPFADGEFGVAATRYSAHHWLDLAGALAEMHRVLAPGGTLIVGDVLGAPDAIADTHLQAMELLRDPGHVRNRTAREWRALIADAGFELRETASHAVRLEFASWVARMRTPAEEVAAIRRLQQRAPRQVAEQLAFEADGSFTVHAGLFLATKASAR